MKAGFSTKDITPPLGTWLSGYSHRDQPCNGINDQLFVRSVAIEDNKGHITVLTTMDLAKLSEIMQRRIKWRIEKETGIPGAALLLNVSHTHCGPIVDHNTQLAKPEWPLNPDYIETLEENIVQGIIEAITTRSEMTIRFAITQADFGVCRRRLNSSGKIEMRANPDGIVDHDLPVLTFFSPDEKLQAIFWSYACHPTSKGGYKVSADYPGAVSRALKKQFGDHLHTLFAQGAGGSSKPCFYNSEDFSFIAASVEEIESLGQNVSNIITKLIKSGNMEALQLDLEASETIIDIPLNRAKIPTAEELFKQLNNEPIKELQRIGYKVLDDMLSDKLQTDYKLYAQRLKLAPGVEFIATSGETTADIGLMIKTLFPDSQIIVLGYSAYTDGYIPSSKMLEAGGYEAEYGITCFGYPAPFSPNIDQIIASGIKKL